MSSSASAGPNHKSARTAEPLADKLAAWAPLRQRRSNRPGGSLIPEVQTAKARKSPFPKMRQNIPDHL